MRRRSDSNGTSDYGQDMSDLELDATAEDLDEAPYSAPSGHRNNALGITTPRSDEVSPGRPSDVSSFSNQFEGGIAPADSFRLNMGMEVVKLTKKKKRKNVTLWLDPTKARVCWHQTSAAKSFFVDDVISVMVGAKSRNARDDILVADEDERNLLTIIYAVDVNSTFRTKKSMHVLLSSDHEMKLWTNALSDVEKRRVASIQALSTSTEKSEQSMRLLWQQAMGRSGRQPNDLFTLEDAKKFCRDVEINCNDKTVEKHFDAADPYGSGLLDYAQYRVFVGSFKERKDVQRLFTNIRSGLDSDMDLDDFFRFLKNDQKVDVDKDRKNWTAAFEKYAKVSSNRAVLPDMQHAGDQKLLSLQGFQHFLRSSYNAPVLSTDKAEVNLNRPLNEYFIASSHNTYLLGRQYGGTSSVEGYIAALGEGCRCIEVDCWDGEYGRPAVTHGRSNTTKIPFEDCISVIARYAFCTSPYPLIISLEVHCNAEQQSVMVDIMKKYFGAMMVTEPITNDTTILPTPEELKNRILIKVKAAEEDDQDRLTLDVTNGRSRGRSISSAFTRSVSTDKVSSYSPVVGSPAGSSPLDSVSTTRGSATSGPTMTPNSSADDSEETPQSTGMLKSRKTRIVPRLGRLGVYVQGMRFPKAGGFADPRCKTPNHIFSFTESTFNSHCDKHVMGNKSLLEEHNVRHLMRVYPAATRYSSENFNPLMTWRRGVQMAALNWQTYDVHQQVNRAMFTAGSDFTGYVLKPDELRPAKHLAIADSYMDSPEKKKDKKLVQFAIEIISAQRLPRPRTRNAGSGMNPYIEFEVFTADDKARGIVISEGGKDASAPDGSSGIGCPVRKRTSACLGNGFDPVWNESISTKLVTKFPSLIFVRWTVMDQAGDRPHTRDPKLATFTAKLSSLQQGYRHLPLFNPQGDRYRDAELFIKIKTTAPATVSPGELTAHGFEDHVASPRPDFVRPDRSWPRRIFSRNPSERRLHTVDGDRRGLLSRTSSMDRDVIR